MARSFETEGVAPEKVSDSVGGMVGLKVSTWKAFQRRGTASRTTLCSRRRSYELEKCVGRSPEFVNKHFWGPSVGRTSCLADIIRIDG